MENQKKRIADLKNKLLQARASHFWNDFKAGADSPVVDTIIELGIDLRNFLKDEAPEIWTKSSPYMEELCKFLEELNNLEILVFSDCNAIKDSSFVNNLKNLKQLSITGSTYFENGDIKNLQRKGLTIGLSNKKHYNVKSSQFVNYFRNPPEQMP